MEKEYQISWLKVIGVFALIIVVIAILCIVYPKRNSKGVSSIYIQNITMMKEAGFEYFQGSNLPGKIGESYKLTLKDMIDGNLVVEFKDANGDVCSKDNSYIQVTKTLENEYNMKVNLDCKENSDYIMTMLQDKTCPDCNTPTNNSGSNDSNKNDVTVKPNNNSSQYSKPSQVVQNVIKNYNINYVDTCGGNDCTNNVLYTIDFVTNGGTPVAQQLKKKGATADYKTTTRDGYHFLGWYLDGVLYDFSTPITRKITLYAKWEEKNIVSQKEYIIDFESNGGTKINSQKIFEGDLANRPSDPYKSCYRFVGWYTNSSLTNKYNFNNKVYKNMTLYAKWENDGSCNQKYDVSFNSNGGSYVATQYDILEGNRAYEPNTPTRSCYRFLGWYTNSNLTNKYNFNNGVYKDMTLYAKWEDDGSCNRKYDVSFNSNGGSYVPTQYDILEGNRAYEPNNPTRSGYRFLGWYTNSNLTNKYNFNNRVYRDITLYAKWEKESNQYYTYCKIVKERYFSTSYVSDNQSVYDYNWTIRFDNIKNVSDLKITKIGYLDTLALYNQSYNNKINGRGISMVGGNDKYSVSFTSGSMLRTYSLKSNNFNKYLSNPYQNNGVWYVTASVRIYNYNGVTSYYAPNLGSGIYFVPFYFDVEYTDQYNCFDDTADNYYKYSDSYNVVNTYYR